MYFEILGPISDVETFATGSKIREVARLRKPMGVDAGGKEKASHKFALQMALSGWLNYIGMRLRELDAKSSR